MIARFPDGSPVADTELSGGELPDDNPGMCQPVAVIAELLTEQQASGERPVVISDQCIDRPPEVSF